MTTLRSQFLAWVGRRYLARKQKTGFDLSKMSFLPDKVLMPLRREGFDPVPSLGEVRRKAPVSRLPVPIAANVWLVTGYDEVKQVLGKAKAFSTDFTNLIGNAGASTEQNPGGLGFADPPVHTRLRRLLTPEFTMRRLSRLTPRIHDIVEECLSTMEKEAQSGEPVDLVKHFALPIPSLVICELLGVPYEDRADFERLSAARFDLFSGASASLGAISESLGYFRELVARQRQEPGDGLIGMILREHGDDVSDEELAGLADGVLTGGFETTASMLALGVLVLLRDREHFAAMAGSEEATEAYVEELLRYLTVVQVAFPRFAREDMEIGGVAVSAGDVVLCSLSGADRDGGLGPDMERFDPHRSVPSHLAFGYGIHRCVGAELARMELRTAYPALAQRFPKMRLAVDERELAFRKLSIVYGVDSVPVHLD